jgi:hypothetical protein
MAPCATGRQGSIGIPTRHRLRSLQKTLPNPTHHSPPIVRALKPHVKCDELEALNSHLRNRWACRLLGTHFENRRAILGPNTAHEAWMRESLPGRVPNNADSVQFIRLGVGG